MTDINHIARTDLGYLLHANDWNEQIALSIAKEENLVLTEEHWQLLFLLRQHYQQYELIPPLRIFIKSLAQQFPAEKSNSVYLHQLFPGGVLKQACKIAGLPKPRHCL